MKHEACKDVRLMFEATKRTIWSINTNETSNHSDMTRLDAEKRYFCIKAFTFFFIKNGIILMRLNVLFFKVFNLEIFLICSYYFPIMYLLIAKLTPEI